MADFATLARFTCGDMTVRYPHNTATGLVGLELFPTVLEPLVVARRTTLDEPEVRRFGLPAWDIDPLLQLYVVGEEPPGSMAQGRTLRNAPQIGQLRFLDQHTHERDATLHIITRFSHPSGLHCEHHLTYQAGDLGMRTMVRVINEADHPVTLGMLASFSLGGITPFAADDAPDRLIVHQIRSAWSAEGRLISTPIEHLHLERSWTGHGVRSERFGQVGSLPVRGFAPILAVEDRVAQVTWGAQLAWAGSWQMEVYRRDDMVTISGGLADREFGHWTKQLLSGEELTTPQALLTVVQGPIDTACQRLTQLHMEAVETQPPIEADLPIICNEYCTSWGQPTHAEVIALADRLRGTPVRYLVIDAGWYRSSTAAWDANHGDWIPSAAAFPEGLAATVAAIRQRGLIPGLWFEWETVGSDAVAFAQTEHLLQRDGVPLQVGGRRFWDLTHPAVMDYLEERVMRLLEKGSFGYLKLDYNETIGLGCDGAESLGEGLRRQILALYQLLQRLRDRLPDLVVEMCASGGQRLEPSLLGYSSMGSFSDAHELPEIPIIAANLHRQMLPRQSQIWAVLRQTDTVQRLRYSLAATFLGRMCLSGDLTALTPAQWEVVEQAMAFYRRVWPLIKHGWTHWRGTPISSYRHPRGWQGILRAGEDNTHALVVIHTFADPPPVIQCDVPEGGVYQVLDSFGEHVTLDTLLSPCNPLHWQNPPSFACLVVHLQRIS